MKLRCFVAMAFEHNDTDKTYKNLIVKSLKSNNIQSVRIDRKEHNNDIDDEIIAELKKCDLIVSDLTYARPSVYFEAGFGAGRFFKEAKSEIIPVIYTCRRDHSKHKENDTYGNFRVHFDLQMKNIIWWLNPSDKEFLRKLKKRIVFVTKPLLRQKRIDEETIKKIAKFKNLSSTTKITKIYDVVVPHYKRLGYRDFAKRGRHSTVNKNFWNGIRIYKGEITKIILRITPSLTKTTIIDLHRSHLSYPTYDLNPPKNSPLKQLTEQMIICSFNKINPAKIMEYLPDFHYDEINKNFLLETTQAVPSRRLPHLKEFVCGYSDESFIGELKRAKDRYSTRVDYLLEDSYFKQEYENSRTYDTKYKKIVKAKLIPRKIAIKFIDGIRYEGDLVL